MPNLKELDLTENEIADVTALQGLTSLRKLNLSKNKLVTLATFPLIPSL